MPEGTVSHPMGAGVRIMKTEVVGYYSVGNRMEMWGKTGAFWGGLWGLLHG